MKESRKEDAGFRSSETRVEGLLRLEMRTFADVAFILKHIRSEKSLQHFRFQHHLFLEHTLRNKMEIVPNVNLGLPSVQRLSR